MTDNYCDSMSDSFSSNSALCMLKILQLAEHALELLAISSFYFENLCKLPTFSEE